MKLRHTILATTVAAFTTLAADAALITWGGAQNISGDSDVSTAGTFVGALNLGSAASPTVNTVNFTGAVPVAGSISAGIFDLTGSLQTFDSTTPALPFGGLSAGYQQLLGPAVFSTAAATITLTMSGLSIGAQYQFQFWSSDSSFIDVLSFTTATAGNSVTLNPAISGGQGSLGEGGLGQYALGTFTADATSQQIVFSTPDFSKSINGLQLRLLAPAAVPEPGTALAGVMLAGLVGLRRRRLTV